MFEILVLTRREINAVHSSGMGRENSQLAKRMIGMFNDHMRDEAGRTIVVKKAEELMYGRQ